MGPDDPLRDRLVERDRERGGVRAGVGDVEQLEQRRHLRLAAAPLEPLGDVEDHVHRASRRAGAAGPASPRGRPPRGRSSRSPRGSPGASSGESYSASSSCSPARSGATRFTLKVKPTLSRSVRRGRPRRRPLVGDPPARRRAADDRVHDRVRVQPLERRGGVDAGPLLERGERVDLEEVELPVVADAEVDPAEVADLEDPVDGLGELAQPLARARRFTSAGARTETSCVEPGLELVVVDGVAPPRGRLRGDDVLDRLQDAAPLRRGRLEERHGHVAARDELLDEDARTGSAPGRVRTTSCEPQRVLHDRVLRDALRAALEVRLHDDRVAQRVELQLSPDRPRTATAGSARRAGRGRAS